MKTSIKLLIGAAVLVGAAVAFAPGPLVKAYTVRTLKASTGFDIEYERLIGNFWKRTVEVEGLVFRNPPDFPDTEAIEVSRLYAKYQWRNLFGDAVKLDELRLDIPRVVMVRKADGETNMERLQEQARDRRGEEAEPRALPDSANTSEPAAPAAKEEPAPPKPRKAKEPDVEIGLLAMKIGKVEIRDYGRMKDGKPRTQEYELNVESSFENVTDLDAVSQQLATQVLIEGGVRALTEQLNDPETMKKLEKNLNKVAEDLGKQLEKFMK